MRRLALLLALAASALSFARSSDEYLKLRGGHKIVQAVSASALREVVKPKVVELQGRVVSTCEVDGTTILVFQPAGGDAVEVEAKHVPAWLAETGADVRLLVRCARAEKGSALKATFLAAAPEIDVLQVEEAYWRKLAAQKRAAARPKTKASRGGAVARPALFGPIGRPVPRRTWVVPRSTATPAYARFIQGYNRRLTAAQATQIAEGVVGLGIQYGVDPRLVVAILIVESGFNPNAVSRVGAVGLGQLMPGTARWMGVKDSYDAMDNLSGMIRLLRTHMNQYRTTDGSNPLVLAAYNAGAGAVRRHGGVPPYRETQNYVKKVTAIYRRLCGISEA